MPAIAAMAGVAGRGDGAMSEGERLTVATRLYVRLRHSSGRLIDSVWMSQNQEYAREILRLARTSTDAEVLRLADRFDELMFGAKPKAAAAPPPAMPAEEPAEPGNAALTAKYLGSLR